MNFSGSEVRLPAFERTSLRRFETIFHRVDATFERIQAAGAEVIQEPIDQPWGPRDCAFRDPAGNVLRFNQLPTQ